LSSYEDLRAWAGACSGRWEWTRLDRVASVRGRLGWKGLKADEYVDDGYALLSTPDIKPYEINWEDVNHITAERYFESPEIILERGDVLLAKDGATLGIVNAVKALPQASTVNSSIAVIRPSTTVQSQFLRYYLASHVIQGHIARMKGGMGVPHLFQADIRKFPVLVPPLSEQLAVADYLDREMQKIDALVTKKRRLIELLEERRLALVSRVVSRGLDPNVPMKDSLVEWLGEIPRHWNTSPLMRLVDSRRPVMYGIVLPGPDFDGGVPIVKGGDVADERLVLELLKRTDPEIEKGYVRSRLKGGDIVYAIRGSIGAAAIVPPALEGANLTQDAARVAPRHGVDPEWLKYTLQSASVFAQLEAGAVGATIRGINIFSLKRAQLPVPPAQEQLAIKEFLDAESKGIDGLLAAAREAIERLGEYRSALITAAVTGQIDVREKALVS
jgi:type I restriction enzyme, S subunit